MKAYNKLKPHEKIYRMRDALNSGANELRVFIREQAVSFGVPELEFKFWLLQSASRVNFDDREFSIKFSHKETEEVT